MNKKTMYIIVAVLVVVIVIAGAAAFVLLNNSGNGGSSPTPTPTPTASVVGATSLQYSVNVTSQGATVTYNFAGKNINTSTLMIRVDLLGGASGNYSYILYAGQDKSWSSVNNGTWKASSDFKGDWNSWGTQWTDYVNKLGSWSGTGNYKYTASDGSSITIFNIAVNPTIADSLFAPS
jgi:hypothetical protein